MKKVRKKPTYRLSQIIYQSTVAVTFSDQTFETFLKKSRMHNKKKNISSLLVHDNGTFLQVLEGPTNAINDVLEALKHDRRHRNLSLEIYRCIDAKEYQHGALDFINAAPRRYVTTEPLRRYMPYGPIGTAIDIFDTLNEKFYAQEAKSWNDLQ